METGPENFANEMADEDQGEIGQDDQTPTNNDDLQKRIIEKQFPLREAVITPPRNGDTPPPNQKSIPDNTWKFPDIRKKSPPDQPS